MIIRLRELGLSDCSGCIDSPFELSVKKPWHLVEKVCLYLSYNHLFHFEFRQPCQYVWECLKDGVWFKFSDQKTTNKTEDHVKEKEHVDRNSLFLDNKLSD